MSKTVCFGEMLLRLGAVRPSLLFQDALLEASFCGAEVNVAVALSGFGHEVEMVTTLPTNRLGEAALAQVRVFGVGTSAINRSNSRMGLYFLSPGAMSRPSEIIYDRAGSAFALASPESYDWAALLNGADWLYIGGITAALGDNALAALRDAVRIAQATGVKIAFDCNFRPSLWQGREDEAWIILRELAEASNVLFAGRRAIGRMLGGTFTDGEASAGFRAAAEAMFAASASVELVAATRRELVNSDSQLLTGLLARRDSFAESATRRLDAIVDRIGTGDAYAAGVMHGLVAGHDLQRIVDFALAAAEWSHSVNGDFLRAKVADIELLYSGNADVRR